MTYHIAELALATGQPITALLEAPPELVKALRAAYNERMKDQERGQKSRNRGRGR